VLGRLDEQVKLRGMRLELGEVEAAAQSCPLVAAAAAAVADARLVLFVKPKVRALQHTRTHIPTHTRTHARTHARMHAHRHRHTDTDTDTQTHTRRSESRPR
jgi:acyl-coenzyme A synthetase/AMP-(fatty) acid ligase